MHPREVLRAAAVQNANAIIIVHNHPSGDPTPSDDDIKATLHLIRAAALLKIELLDHVIIGDPRREKCYASLRKLGYFQTEEVQPEQEAKNNFRDVRDAAEEVNHATVQSNVLLELIEAHLDHRENRGGEDFTGERAEQFNFGLGLLANYARERLQKASDNLMDLAFPNRMKIAS